MEDSRHLLQHFRFASLRAAARQNAGELGGYICNQIAGAFAGSYKEAVARKDWRGTNYSQMVQKETTILKDSTLQPCQGRPG